MGKKGWDALLGALPPDDQSAFQKALRQALARKLARLTSERNANVPQCVRQDAVGTWRKTYMQGASKSATRRMSYSRLRNKQTYAEIELRLLREYWVRRLPPATSDVDSMSFGELCQTFRTIYTYPQPTGLENMVNRMLKDVYEQTINTAELYDHIAQAICDTARTTTDALDSFSLQGATSEEQVAERIGASRVIDKLARSRFGKRPLAETCARAISQRVMRHRTSAALQGLLTRLTGTSHPLRKPLRHLVRKDASAMVERLRSSEFKSQLAQELLQNPRYAREFEQSVELLLRVRQSVPASPMDAFPLARTMRRRFVVHVGPTNSGKTHDAIRALMEGASGAYLGPLRLLAYEQFEHLNHNGCPCSLLTGEELVEVAGSKHVSSTVEMANFGAPIDVAVIDEAQMVGDQDRGHNWTSALLGIPAREVHVCCAAHAEQVVCQLIRLCEDEFEVVRHQRLVPLRLDRGGFRLPADVRRGDALVVFSRKSVHGVARMVNACGLRTSLIYGALPHEVRHEEARKFDKGETDVVVATDAIGMGMNLPIRRVVFVEQEKFDGRTRRLLQPSEIQQIAGRAGRYGRYDIGLFQSTRKRQSIAERYFKDVAAIETIPVGIPQNIALVRDATLGDSIRQWMSLSQPAPFGRIDISRNLRLISYVEARLCPKLLCDIATKSTVLALATMPFDDRDRRLLHTWHLMVAAQLEGHAPDVDEPRRMSPSSSLLSLEAEYRYCDLLYTYERMFGCKERMLELVSLRDKLAETIMQKLAADKSDLQLEDSLF